MTDVDQSQKTDEEPKPRGAPEMMDEDKEGESLVSAAAGRGRRGQRLMLRWSLVADINTYALLTF